MTVEQIYTGCLAQGAYYIRSENEAAIIDPLREVSPYIERAKADGVTIKYVFETHFHADFVSGHVTLADKTGAAIVYGPTAEPSFKAHVAEDGELFQIGKVTLKALHTPGHTMESTTYLLLDEAGQEVAIFTGDTLFLGDVGRPDLAQKSASMTQEELAGILYDSLRTKIMPLPDHITVYPAHGAGSACGKNMMKETIDTLGNQKQINYALRADMTREEFIEEVTDGLMPPPAYFPLNVKMNREGYDSIDDVLANGTRPLAPADFELVAEEMEALILDVRSPAEYAAGHIPRSIFIGLDGGFAPWVGELIVDTLQPLLLVVPADRAEEAVTRLSRVGFDRTLGYLDGGLAAWQAAGKEIDTVVSVSPQAFAQDYERLRDRVFDVRKPSEYQAEHVAHAHNLPLSEINQHLALLPKEQEFAVHCAGGYRSMIAASMLKARGYHNLIDVQGGFKSIKETTVPTTSSTASATLK